MIDWKFLTASTLWVLGLSVILAAFSLASYRAAADRRLRPMQRHVLLRRLGGPAFRLPFLAGLGLAFLGALLSSSSVWERIICAAGLGLCLVAVGSFLKQGPNWRQDSPDEE